MREHCDGSGLPATDTRYRNTICPVCRGIAQLNDNDTIADHTVLVILGDEDE